MTFSFLPRASASGSRDSKSDGKEPSAPYQDDPRVHTIRHSSLHTKLHKLTLDHRRSPVYFSSYLSIASSLARLFFSARRRAISTTFASKSFSRRNDQNFPLTSSIMVILVRQKRKNLRFFTQFIRSSPISDCSRTSTTHGTSRRRCRSSPVCGSARVFLCP